MLKAMCDVCQTVPATKELKNSDMLKFMGFSSPIDICQECYESAEISMRDAGSLFQGELKSIVKLAANTDEYKTCSLYDFVKTCKQSIHSPRDFTTKSKITASIIAKIGILPNKTTISVNSEPMSWGFNLASIRKVTEREIYIINLCAVSIDKYKHAIKIAEKELKNDIELIGHLE
jgi:hypothetical protein